MTRILVAEDEPIARMDLCEMLQNLGYSVVGEAGDGVAAVNLARALKPDLVVMDIKMPLRTGFDEYAEDTATRVLRNQVVHENASLLPHHLAALGHVNGFLGQLLGETEIHEHRLAAIGLDDDVARLDVAVDDAVLVGILHGAGQPGDEVGTVAAGRGLVAAPGAH